jgi:hypothetical protein
MVTARRHPSQHSTRLGPIGRSSEVRRSDAVISHHPPVLPSSSRRRNPGEVTGRPVAGCGGEVQCAADDGRRNLGLVTITGSPGGSVRAIGLGLESMDPLGLLLLQGCCLVENQRHISNPGLPFDCCINSPVPAGAWPRAGQLKP